jgi:hypothetical protein
VEPADEEVAIVEAFKEVAEAVEVEAELLIPDRQTMS